LYSERVLLTVALVLKMQVLKHFVCGGAADWQHWGRVRCAHCDAVFSLAQLVYTLDLDSLPEPIASCFVPLSCDEDTNTFLLRSFAASGLGACLLGVACHFLRTSHSLTDANGLLGRGEMFVLSTDQAKTLLRQRSGGVLLDVGAGDGAITTRLAPLFDTTIASESSAPMVRRLRARGLTAFAGEDLSGLDKAAAAAGITLCVGNTVDCISLLNVLDRCDRPLRLLKDLRARLRPGGLLLLAVVLPFRPIVERSVLRCPPRERLPLPPSATFERSAAILWEQVLEPAGFELESFTRVPYLSMGDHLSPVFSLDDAVWVLRRPEYDDVSSR
jgi:SAM-dependent methyltransferase